MDEIEDFDALFDSVAFGPTAASTEATAVPTSSSDSIADPVGGDDVYRELGIMARVLHDNMKALGYDKSIGGIVESDMPDVKSRLDLVVKKTEAAATKTLESAEESQKILADLSLRSKAASDAWNEFIGKPGSVEDFRLLVMTSLTLHDDVAKNLRITNDLLMSIILAQDYQDLTGQVIRKTVEITESVEKQLINLLIAAAPVERKTALGSELLNGPAISENSPGVVDQAHVDELLANLGF